jgi:hypothetical protein
MCLVSGEGVIDVSLFKKIEDSQGNSKSKKTNKRQKEDQENFLIKCRIGQRPVLWPDSGHCSILFLRGLCIRWVGGHCCSKEKEVSAT